MDFSLEQPMSGLTARELNRVVSDPAVFCGGGSVAALTGSGAASLIELVLRLSSKRRANREFRESIENDLQRSHEIQDTLYQLADQDIEVLDALLIAQRAAKESEDRAGYVAALLGAANSPLAIGRECIALLEIIDAQLARATRFTVSDLGAAAALAQSAVQAVVFTAEVNLALLREERAEDPSVINDLEREVDRQLDISATIATSVFERTSAAIHRQPREERT